MQNSRWGLLYKQLIEELFSSEILKKGLRARKKLAKDTGIVMAQCSGRWVVPLDVSPWRRKQPCVSQYQGLDVVIPREEAMV